jgi:adenylate cyclase
MDSRIKNYIKSIGAYFLTITLTWIVAFFFLVVFQVDEDGMFSVFRIQSFQNILLTGIISGIVWGGIYKFVQYIRSQIPTYFLAVVISLFTNICSAYLLMYIRFHLADILIIEDMPVAFTGLSQLYNSQLFYTILVYFFIIGTLIEIFYDVDRKFGKGILLKFLLGKYYKPKEEERIFLFMDLKSSTYYAEKLGHFKYSRLIQDCFKDISSAVTKNKAEIYQYVGDEVVLTWKMKNGLGKSRCLQVVYDFMEVLEKKKEYYQKNYGMVPIFKAGVHSGKVMVAQVGELKSEIAYHGDAINTAARIQGLCNSYQSRLLISGNLFNQLNGEYSQGIGCRYLGEVLLTGKETTTELYTFELN